MNSVDSGPLGCLIVGAGFGGIAMARALQREGDPRFLIIEKASRAGGTWRDNAYPGAACDVPSHLYSLSDAPNPGWSRLFPSQPEILDYLERLARPFEQSDRLRYGCRLVAARWVDSAHCWEAELDSGERLLARDLVLATGGLHHPAWPALPGLEDFAGPHLHTARWDPQLDLRGKRVGLIGSGASAVQVIPAILPEVAELHVAMRTPPWVLPRPDVAIPDWLRRRLAAWPWLRLGLRGAIFCMLELLALALIAPRSAFWARWLGHRLRRRQVADPVLREALRPDYPLGCKRVLFSSEVYPALADPKTRIERGPIRRVTARGWQREDGSEQAFDVLVCATGFEALRLLDDVRIAGRDGLQLNEAWHDRPRAHLGIAAAGFPNLFFLLGPNTALGHNSVIHMIESQVRHIQALRRLRRERATPSVEPERPVQDAFYERLDRRFAGTAWSGGCTSWYLDRRGQNIALWVGTALSYRRATAHPDATAYRFG